MWKGWPLTLVLVAGCPPVKDADPDPVDTQIAVPPDSEVPDTEVLDLDTEVLDTEVPDTEVPDTEVPGTDLPADSADSPVETAQADTAETGETDLGVTDDSANSASLDDTSDTADSTDTEVPDSDTDTDTDTDTFQPAPTGSQDSTDSARPDSAADTSDTADSEVVTVDEQSPTWPPGNTLSVSDLTDEAATLSWSAAEDDEGVVAYRLSLDGIVVYEGPATSTAVSLTPATTYAASVEALDEAGNVSSGGPTLSFTTPDTVAPAWPTGSLLADEVGTTTASLVWSGATDAVGVTAYRLSRDGILLTETTSTTFSATDLSPGTPYTFAVQAGDGAGNWSTDGPNVSFTTLDSQAPTWPLLSELTADKVGETSALLFWTTAEDDVAVTAYRILLDGAVIGEQPATDPRSFDLLGLTPWTAYQVRILAGDGAGNWSASGPARIFTTADMHDPSWPAPASAVVTDIQDTAAQATWTAAADNVGVSAYQVWLNDVLRGETSETQWVLTSLLPDTAYTLRIEAMDAAGGVTDDGPTTSFTTTAPAPSPEPAEVAPGLPATGLPTFADEVGFLVDEGLQVDVEPEALDDARLVVLQGTVRDPAGDPLPAVQVTVLGHDELGVVFTQADGGYDMLANGGAKTTLLFVKDGYIPAQRTVVTGWEAFEAFDDLVLLPHDPTCTEIDLATAITTTVATGSLSTDADGDRQAALMFEPGTTASYTDTDGNTVPLSTIDVRITEYTVGDDGPDRMPAALPPTSAYTYAVELSVDEVVANGVKLDGVDVVFDEPVSFYVTDFLGFEPGTPVPTGYYDNTAAVWVAVNDGLVIEVLGDLDADGRSEVDVDGTGLPADPAMLLDLGFTDDERQRLEETYLPGDVLWRVELTHFSTWDCNWPYRPSDGAERPNNGRPKRGDDDGSGTPCPDEGSVILTEDQTLVERVPVVGLPWGLTYRSDRVWGRRTERTLDIQLTPDAGPPAATNSVMWSVEVAGENHSGEVSSAAGQSISYTWDGLDTYGRPMTGAEVATVRIGYVYDAVYATPDEMAASFADAGGDVTALTQRMETVIWQEFEETLLAWRGEAMPVGGWGLDVHHVWDDDAGMLLRGDGTTVEAEMLGTVATVVSDIGTTDPADGVPVDLRDARMTNIEAMDYAPDGTLFISARGPDIDHGGYVYAVDPDTQLVSLIVGGAVWNEQNTWEGQPGTNIDLGHPTGLVADEHGGFYIIMRCTLLYFDSDYTVHNVVKGNNGGCGTHGGDGGLALDADLDNGIDLALAPDGRLFIADDDAELVRVIHTDGTIETYAGGGLDNTLVDGMDALDYNMMDINAIALGPDGELYIATDRDHVLVVDSSGTISLFAGGGSPADSWGDGADATEADFDTIHDLLVDDVGNLYILADMGVRRVDTTGRITTLAGHYTGSFGWEDGVPAYGQRIGGAGDALVQTPDGETMYASGSRIWKLAAPSAVGLDEATRLVPSADGREMYGFDARGVHHGTWHALTGAMLRAFTYEVYDGEDLLTEVDDAVHGTLTIARATDGTPTALITAAGRTELTIEDGYLTEVTSPAAETVVFTYDAGDADGLMLTRVEPEGGQHTWTYDLNGRLETDSNPSGRDVTLSREEISDGYRVTYSADTGRSVVYETDFSQSDRIRVSKTTAHGETLTHDRFDDGRIVTTWGDGTTLEVTQGPDERFGMLAPVNESITWTRPSGSTYSITGSRTVTLDEAYDPFSLLSLETSATDSDGQEWSEIYDAVLGTWTTTFPDERMLTATMDSLGRTAAYSYDGTDEVTLTWGDDGLEAMTQGSTTLGWTYGSDGFVDVETVKGGVDVGYTWNGFGKLDTITWPSSRVWSFGYDGDGLLSDITTPSTAQHALGRDLAGRLTSYTPPIGAAWGMTWTDDDQLESLTFPAEGTLTRAYDTGGRLESWTYGDAVVTLGWDGDTTRLASSTWTPTTGTAQTLTRSWDGDLWTGTTYSGLVSATATVGYRDGMNVDEVAVVAGSESHTAAVTVDEADRLTAWDGHTFTRDGPNSTVDSITDGVSTWTIDLDSTWDLVGRSLDAVYDLSLSRDTAGRIAARTETFDGTTRVTTYTYDDDGRLESETTDGTLVGSYTYDDNGSRLTRTTPSGTESWTTDAADRLTSDPDGSVTTDDDGHVTAIGGDSYVWSARNELLEATVDGVTVTYTYDGLGRRIARTGPDGTTGYLYAHPMASYLATHSIDPSGVLTAYTYDDFGRLLSFHRNSTTWRVGTDHVGTPVVVANSSGTVVRTLRTDAFGVVIDDSDPSFELAIGFAGGVVDPDTGLVRFMLRDYHPDSGRWMTRDPGGFAHPTLHPWVYVGSDPVNMIDPSGLVGYGISGYYILGGGGKVLWDPIKGELGVCIEVGAGLGAGFELTTAGPKESESFTVEAGVECGPLGLTGKYEIDGCGDSFKVEGKVGPASVEWDGSEVEGKLSKDIFEDDDGGASDGKTIKCKPQVKGAYEKCWKTWP